MNNSITSLAPIVLFTYNRPEHTEQTLIALSQNDLASESKLFIFSDAAKGDASTQEIRKIIEVRKIIRKKLWCKEVQIIERQKNWGLADNIVNGVTQIINQYGNIIVLEDDIVTSKGFLKYMNESLNLYKTEDKVMHISGYTLPVEEKLAETFFYNATSCWGWGTWERAWKHYQPDASVLLKQITNIKHFNLDSSYDFYSHLLKNVEGTLKTWAIKWHSSVYLRKGLCLHPRLSLVQNIGMDGSGIHSGKVDIFNGEKLANSIQVEKIPLAENEIALKAIKKFYRKKSSFRQRIAFKINSLFNS